jgi:hypothetical protein
MVSAKIELRVAALEAEITQLKEQVQKGFPPGRDWLDEVYGAFADDPDFQEAMRLGRKYRESLRPRAGKRPPRGTVKKSVKRRRR